MKKQLLFAFALLSTLPVFGWMRSYNDDYYYSNPRAQRTYRSYRDGNCSGGRCERRSYREGYSPRRERYSRDGYYPRAERSYSNGNVVPGVAYPYGNGYWGPKAESRPAVLENSDLAYPYGNGYWGPKMAE